VAAQIHSSTVDFSQIRQKNPIFCSCAPPRTLPPQVNVAWVDVGNAQSVIWEMEQFYFSVQVFLVVLKCIY
jgi:hypothetical protein